MGPKSMATGPKGPDGTPQVPTLGSPAPPAGSASGPGLVEQASAGAPAMPGGLLGAGSPLDALMALEAALGQEEFWTPQVHRQIDPLLTREYLFRRVAETSGPRRSPKASERLVQWYRDGLAFAQQIAGSPFRARIDGLRAFLRTKPIQGALEHARLLAFAADLPLEMVNWRGQKSPTYFDGLGWIPEGAEFPGDLHLRSPKFDRLPRGLRVEEKLSFFGEGFTVIPGSVSVGCGDFFGTAIEVIESGFSCAGDLDLSRCPLLALPEGFVVGGSLLLVSVPLTELPKGLVVGGSLSLRASSVRTLPHDLRVLRGINILETALLDMTDAQILEMAPGIRGGIIREYL